MVLHVVQCYIKIINRSHIASTINPEKINQSASYISLLVIFV